MLTEKDRQLAIKARDTRDTYDAMNTLYQKGEITLDQIMEYKVAAEKADKELRAAIKKGAYRDIEKDLKKKFNR